MTGKKRLLPIMIGSLVFVLTACGPSRAKLSEAEDARSLLVEAKNTAEETYLDISDESQRSALDELAQKEAEYEAIDFSKKNDKEIDELLPQIKELTQQYQNIQGNLSGTLQSETEVREEKEKHTELSVYFVNKTGLDLSKIVLHDLTRDSYSDNYIGEGVLLNSGYTLMGVSLDIYTDSSQWEFIVADEAGTDHILACDDLKGQTKEKMAIELNYDESTGEGSAVFAN